MNKDEVLKLAKLARISISNEEAESLSHEFDSILKYVGEVRSVNNELGIMNKEDFPIRNVMRADGEGHESGIYTEKILAEASSREGNYIKVKKIL